MQSLGEKKLFDTSAAAITEVYCYHLLCARYYFKPILQQTAMKKISFVINHLCGARCVHTTLSCSTYVPAVNLLSPTLTVQTEAALTFYPPTRTLV